MNGENIKHHIENDIAFITISREAQLNALNKNTLEEIAELLAQLQTNIHVKALLITGAGEKAFVAGADIKEFMHFDTKAGEKLAREGQNKVFNTIANFPKPILAAINGFALGGGLELALAAHMRVASTQAKMGLPEVSLGLIPGYGGTQRLTQLVGKGKAIELICTGEMINASTAFQIGLINHICEPDELIDFSTTLLHKITNKSPIALQYALEAIQQAGTTEGYETEIQNFGKLFQTEDFIEGTQAFIEKRKATFKGR